MKHFFIASSTVSMAPAPDDVVRKFGREPSADTENLTSVVSLGLTLLDASPDHIQLIDARGKVLWMNQAARTRRWVGIDKAGRLADAAGYWPKLAARQLAIAIADAKNGASSCFSTTSNEADGKRWWDIRITRIPADDDLASHYLSVAHDVTAQHLAIAAAERAVGYDTLTGLAGGDLFRKRIDALVAADDFGFSVLVTDLDQLRDRNDLLGRDAGDEVLRTVASRLVQSLRKGEIAARLSGDKFGVILRHQIGDMPDHLWKRALGIVNRLGKSIHGETRQPGISASFGLARCPIGNHSPGTVYRNAQYALEAAKEGGQGQLVEFDESLQKTQAIRMAMLANAECALTSKNIMPYYQPKVDLRTGRIVGFEALLRWRSTSGTVEPPSGIWAAFADPALSRRITETMLGRVIVDLQRWQRRGITVPVAINIADADLRQLHFAERLIHRLTAAGLPASSIEVEITETAALGRNSDHVAGMLGTLRAAGIRIALDDFGTGYASLLNLKHLPVDVIKIDRSFVSDIGTHSGDRAIVEALLSIAARLGIEVVAEGIETKEHAAFLHARGCRFGQGYLFGEAVPAHQVPMLLAAPVLDIGTSIAIGCTSNDCSGIRVSTSGTG